MFWINFNRIEKFGSVHFKLFGQACNNCFNDCSEKINFSGPCWYKEEISKVGLIPFAITSNHRKTGVNFGRLSIVFFLLFHVNMQVL